MEKYNIVLRNGLVIDGNGGPGITSDIAIRDGRIESIGCCNQSGYIEIEAGGLVVSPGFIDVHSHDDLAVLSDPEMNFKLSQGVTTDIVGNCGWAVTPRSTDNDEWVNTGILGSDYPLSWDSTDEYISHINDSRPSCNVGVLIGYGAVRRAVIEGNSRKVNDAEIGALRELVIAGMEAGAIGVSTGLVYDPQSSATTEEIVRVIEPVGARRGVYVSHVRNEGDRLVESIREAISIGRDGGCSIHISHHKALGRENWGKVEETIALIDSARGEGIDVTADVYPYTAGSTLLSAIMAEGGDSNDASSIVVASSSYPHSIGRPITELAGETGLSVEEVVSLMLATDPGTVVIRHAMAEEDVRKVLGHEVSMVGSDGLPSEAGKPHPRLYGTFPRVLGRYVRDLGVLSLPEAVRRMTSLPAKKFGFASRGQIRKGWFADLTLFDPEQIADRATYDEPRLLSTGIHHVIVNGELVVREGEHIGTRNGLVLAPSGHDS